MKATRVKQGKFQVVECTPREGKTDIVTPISDWMPIAEYIKERLTNFGIFPTSAELVKGTIYDGIKFGK